MFRCSEMKILEQQGAKVAKDYESVTVSNSLVLAVYDLCDLCDLLFPFVRAQPDSDKEI
jgi:hypothetical protein